MDDVKLLKNKKIVGIKGFRADRRCKRVSPQYILFNDGKTYMEIDSSDCNCCYGQTLNVWQDKKRWEAMKNNPSGHYIDAQGNF
jgi:hypothetical protein